MREEATQLAASGERSPLEFTQGIYIRDAPGFGGAAAFTWFADDAEALAYLSGKLVKLYLDAEGNSDDTSVVSRAIGVVLHDVRTLSAIELASMNVALSGLCELVWAGGLDELRTGDMPFARQIQDDFHQNVFGDERGQTDSEMDDFARHLEHYSG